MKILSIIVIFIAIFILRDLILVVLAAIVLASAVEPAVKWLVKNRVPRTLSVLLLYVGIAASLSVFVVFLMIPLVNELSGFLVSIPDYLNNNVLSSLKENPIFGSQNLIQNISDALVKADLGTQINDALSGFYGGFTQVISTVFGGILNFIIIVVISFYLAVQEDGVGKFLRTITPSRHRKYVIHLWRRSEEKIGLWMQGQILLMVIISVLVYLGLTLIGVPHSLILAASAGLLEIIPLFGPVLAAIPAVILAMMTDGITSALIVVGLYVIIQQFENHLIYPLVVKKVVGVNPIMVIVALIAGYELAGFLGLLLSVPFSAVLMEFLNDLQRDKVEIETE